MKPFTGKASVTWDGSAKQGRGAINGGGILSRLPYAFGQRALRNATHPSELIAAAHAGSFSMTLADELEAYGYPVHRIDTAATVTMEHIGTRWTMSRIHLDVTATVEDGEQFDFVDATLRAKANCPVSRLMNASISMQAKLNRRLATECAAAGKAAKGSPSGKQSNLSKITRRPKLGQRVAAYGMRAGS